jgi:transcriptional regulator with XRE-family HTH domain
VNLQPGKRVKYWRELKGISQSDLAARAKMDKTKLSRIESGEQKVRALEIERLARELELTMPEFYGSVEDGDLS